MIPKVIHYCWFGGNELPEEYALYIQGWRDLHPGWEIIRWDESNSPMDLQYVQNAQKNKKWANMSNLVRFYALLKHGGIYLDTDMKLLKSFEPLLTNKCFLGFEEGEDKTSEFWVNNAVIGSLKKHSFIQNCFDSLLKEFDGLEAANLSAPRLVTKLLKEVYGLHEYGFQVLKDVTLYPVSFFYPVKYQYAYKIPTIDIKNFSESYAIHTWGRTWYTREIAIQEIDELRKWSDDLSQQLEKNKKIYSEENTNQQLAIGNLKIQEIKLSEQITNLSAKNNLLQGQHQGMFEKVEEYNSVMNELRLQNGELTEKAHELTHQIGIYQNKEKEILEKIEKQNLDFEQLKINESLIIAERADLNKKLFQMKQELDECILVRDELFLKNNRLSDQIKEFVIEKEKNEEKINFQEEELEALQGELSTVKNNYSLLENEQKLIILNRIELTNNFQKQHAEDKIVTGNLSNGIINLLESIKEKNEDLISYSNQIKAKNNELDEKKLENVNLKNRIEEQLISLNDANAQLQELINTNDWYKRTYKERKLIGIIKDRIVSLFK